MSELPEFVLERLFDAPRELVWRAWTDPELLSRWYGPNIETIIHGFDLKPGGSWLNEMKMRGSSFFSKMVFQEVKEPSLLVWHHFSSTDAEWNDIANPMMENWPRVLLTTVSFEERGAATMVKLTWVPFEASDAEIECFDGSVHNMGMGWESGYAIMDELLVELLSGDPT